MTEAEYELFRSYIYDRAAIHLGPTKRDLLAGRLVRRLRELGLTTYGEYYHRLAQGDQAEEIRLLDAVSTNETRFFREPQHFEFLETVAFPRWEALAGQGRMPRRIRMWSAACATGEEVYTLGMVAEKHFPAGSGWDVEILATDLSVKALEVARAAVWPMDQRQEIPESYLKAYMLKGVGSQRGKMRAGPEIRARIRFSRVNLNNEVYAVGGPFNVIFCRNVLIYFDTETKQRVVDRLLGYLAPGGYLVLGQVESATGLTERVRAVGPTIYVRADAAAPALPGHPDGRGADDAGLSTEEVT